MGTVQCVRRRTESVTPGNSPSDILTNGYLRGYPEGLDLESHATLSRPDHLARPQSP